MTETVETNATPKRDMQEVSAGLDAEFIPANTKPARGGWHWPTYWQVQADNAKDVTAPAQAAPQKIVAPRP